MGLEKDTVLRKVEKKNQAKAGIPERQDPQSISQVLSSESQPFGEYLASMHDPALGPLIERLESGAYTQSDMPTLVRLHQGYALRKENGEKLLGTLNEYIDEMIRESKDPGGLRELADSFGAANLKNVMQQGLRELAVKDPTEFNRVVARYKDLAEFDEKEDKPLTERIKKFCESHKLNDDKIVDALNDPDAQKRLDNVRKVFREKMTTRGERFRDTLKGFIGWGSKRKAQRIAVEDIPAFTKKRDDLLKDGGDYMRALIESHRPEMHEALMRTVKDEQPTFKEGFETKMQFSEFSELYKDKERYTKVAILDRAKEFRKKHASADWSKKSVRDKMTQTFLNEEEASLNDFKKKKGFFAKLLQGLATMFDAKRAKTDIESILK